MSAQNLTISIEQGATWQRTLTITDDGIARDLTGYTARMQIRRLLGSSDAPLVDLPGDSGALSITPSTGVIVLILPAATTAALPVPNRSQFGMQTMGVWSLELTSGAGVVERILEGTVQISAEVTR